MRALRRAQARFAATSMGHYEAAHSERGNEGWVATDGSADSMLYWDLKVMRDRSRELNRNDAVASSITRAFVDNVVGTGLVPQSAVDPVALGITDDQALEWGEQIEAVFRRWMPFADATDRLDFFGLQALAYRKRVEDGEAFLHPTMVRSPWRPYETCVETIEAERVDTPNGTDTKTMRQGIVLSESTGAPVSYWVLINHPGDLFGGTERKFRRVDARTPSGRRNMIHLYSVQRPGQSRGVPLLAAVMSDLHALARYEEAEQVAARIAACFALAITKNDPGSAFQQLAEDATGKKREYLEPGLISHLAPGENVVPINPTRPSSTFPDYVEHRVRRIGAGVGLPLELVLTDFSKTNYSSARAALLEARRTFRREQMHLASTVCQPIWEAVIEEAVVKGEVKPPADFWARKDLWLRASWTPPGWGWVDPKAEVESSQLAIENNLSTLADECAAQGRDWNDVLRQRAREKQRMRELDLIPEPVAAPAQNQTQMPDMPPEEPSDDE